MPTWSQRVKLLFFFLYFGKKLVIAKKKKKRSNQADCAQFHMLQHTCRCGPGVYRQQKPMTSQFRHRPAQRLFFCGQKKIFYWFFQQATSLRRRCRLPPQLHDAHAHGGGLRPFCLDSPAGGWPSLFYRQTAARDATKAFITSYVL